jgi:hypothetical protein
MDMVIAYGLFAAAGTEANGACNTGQNARATAQQEIIQASGPIKH